MTCSCADFLVTCCLTELLSAAQPTDLDTQKGLAEAWRQVLLSAPSSTDQPSRQTMTTDKDSRVVPAASTTAAAIVVDSIAAAVQTVQQYPVDKDVNKNVLVTGSLHLVGGTMEVAGLVE